MATAHKLARTFYFMLKNRQPYQGQSAEVYDAQEREREIARLTVRPARSSRIDGIDWTKKAHKLGLELVPPAALPAALPATS